MKLRTAGLKFREPASSNGAIVRKDKLQLKFISRIIQCSGSLKRRKDTIKDLATKSPHATDRDTRLEDRLTDIELIYSIRGNVFLDQTIRIG